MQKKIHFANISTKTIVREQPRTESLYERKEKTNIQLIISYTTQGVKGIRLVITNLKLFIELQKATQIKALNWFGY